MKRVRDKTCVITGAALGIGRACALRLAEEGANVALWDVLDAPANALAAELAARGSKVRYWHVDVSSEAMVASAMQEVAAHFGSVDVVVNNAGIAGVNCPTHEVTEAQWDAVMAINVKGVFFCTKHAIAHLQRAGGGSIINLSSIYGLISAADIPPYHASKGAVRLMTKTDALFYAKDKIRVNSIHPGFIWTPLVETHLRNAGAADVDAARADVGRLHPLGHMGEPDDIAWAVVFLASDESKFMTGSEMVIDGGYTAR
jgi:NAD(P)-dependent dehydrogenase (short-subunit alcohol dehydrogenase family)